MVADTRAAQRSVLVVNTSRCYGCAACIAMCAPDALTMSGLLVVVDEESCTVCELCIPACPVFALSLE